MLRWKGPRRCGARWADSKELVRFCLSGYNSQHVHKVAEERLGPPQLTLQKSNKASKTFPFWKQPGSQATTGHKKGWCSGSQDYFSTTKLMYYSKSFLFFIFLHFWGQTQGLKCGRDMLHPWAPPQPLTWRHSSDCEGQERSIIHLTTSTNTRRCHPGLEEHTCNPNTHKAEQKDWELQSSWKQDPVSKKNN